MTIDEAIATQVRIRDGEIGIPEDKWVASCNLGIEALKWIERRRENYRLPPILPLPGETKE